MPWCDRSCATRPPAKFSSIVLGIVKSPVPDEQKTEPPTSVPHGKSEIKVKFITKKQGNRMFSPRSTPPPRRRRDPRAAAPEAMVPAATALAQTASPNTICRPLRLSRDGARLLGPRHRGALAAGPFIFKPLEPYRDHR
jgi:hypothetical protein